MPVALEVPYLLLGLLLLVGAVSGSLACGWACPFGFVQDLLGRIPIRKVALPAWVGYTRYVVLVGLVILLPLILGFKGIPFGDQVISICRLCPAGALEAGLPTSAQSVMAGNGWPMSWFKTLILVAFIASALFVHRPWCRIFCPLGGLLALFNRFSLFHLRFNPQECVECNLCRSRCPDGRERGPEGQRLRLHPLPGMQHLRGPGALLRRAEGDPEAGAAAKVGQCVSPALFSAGNPRSGAGRRYLCVMTRVAGLAEGASSSHSPTATAILLIANTLAANTSRLAHAPSPALSIPLAGVAARPSARLPKPQPLPFQTQRPLSQTYPGPGAGTVFSTSGGGGSETA